MKRANRKVIISCAITGSTHTPSMSEYLPLTPEQIARQSIEAAEAGAAIIHLHARNPEDGRPTPDPATTRTAGLGRLEAVRFCGGPAPKGSLRFRPNYVAPGRIAYRSEPPAKHPF